MLVDFGTGSMKWWVVYIIAKQNLVALAEAKPVWGSASFIVLMLVDFSTRSMK